MSDRIVTNEQEIRRKRLEKRKRVKAISTLTYITFLAGSVLLFVIIKGFNILPAWGLIAIGAVFLVLLIPLGCAAFIPGIVNGTKITQSILCVFLATLMIFGCIKLPVYKGSLEKAFVKVPETGELNINVYTMKSAEISSLEQLAGKKVGIQDKLDSVHQQGAISMVNNEIEGDDIEAVGMDGIYAAVDALYAGEVSAILLNESYADIIIDNEDYSDFEEKTNVLYTCTQKVNTEVVTEKVNSITTEPFIVAITGVDEWSPKSLNPTATPRSDVNMIAVVNPAIKQILLVSIPRDSYVYLDVDASAKGYDKLTHATTFGMDVWVKALNELLDTKIHYYLRVNFLTVKDAVNAIGGIDVYNDGEAFRTNYVCYVDENGNNPRYEWNKIFYQGYNHLNGEEALGYCRERAHLENGDIDRNRHQIEVMKACIKKVCSTSIISNIDDLLKAMEGKFTTNLQMDDIYALIQMQLNDMSDWDIVQYGILGNPSWGYCLASGTYSQMSIVNLYDASVELAREYIKQALSGEKVVIY